MTAQFKIGEEFQKVSKESFDAAVHAYGEANQGSRLLLLNLLPTSRTRSRTRPVPSSN
jgi:hypothetical protein